MRIAACVMSALMLVGCGDNTQADPPTPTPPSANEVRPASSDPVNGQAVYVQSCLLCHQHDGGGVPDMQPALVGSAIASGDADVLIDLVLRGIGGKAPALPASGKYAMVMPGAMHLNDQQIADLLTYIRQEYAKAGPISPEEVAAVRAKLE